MILWALPTPEPIYLSTNQATLPQTHTSKSNLTPLLALIWFQETTSYPIYNSTNSSTLLPNPAPTSLYTPTSSFVITSEPTLLQKYQYTIPSIFTIHSSLTYFLKHLYIQLLPLLIDQVYDQHHFQPHQWWPYQS